MRIAICDDNKLDAKRIEWALLDLGKDMDITYYPSGHVLFPPSLPSHPRDHVRTDSRLYPYPFPSLKAPIRCASHQACCRHIWLFAYSLLILYKSTPDMRIVPQKTRSLQSCRDLCLFESFNSSFICFLSLISFCCHCTYMYHIRLLPLLPTTSIRS